MGRVRTRMELVTSEKKRESMFQMRSKSMKKKAYELSTLCGVKVGMILCSASGQINTEIWLKDGMSTNILLNDMITSYRNQHKKKNFNAAHFLGETKKQIQEKDTTWSPSFEDMSVKELRDFATYLDNKAESVKERIRSLKRGKYPAVYNEKEDVTATDSTRYLNYQMPQTQTLPMTPNSSSESFERLLDTSWSDIYNMMTETSTNSCTDFGTPWAHQLPLLVDPTPSTSSVSTKYPVHMREVPSPITTPEYPTYMSSMIPTMSSASKDYPIHMQEVPSPMTSLEYPIYMSTMIQGYPYEFEDSRPLEPQYFDAPACQRLEPNIHTSSNLISSNCNVWRSNYI